MADDPVTTARKTVLKTCACACPTQDKLHGNGNRVHNATTKNSWRCTSCGTTRT